MRKASVCRPYTRGWWLCSAKPPVCKIADYSKFLYEIKRKQKEAKKNQKVTDVKEIEQKEAERQAKLAFEKKQKEKNMSFEELLDKYGDSGSKF